jgi:hypothetical protein
MTTSIGCYYKLNKNMDFSRLDSFRFDFCGPNFTFRSIEDFLCEYIFYISLLKTECENHPIALHASGTWRIVVELDTVEHDEITKGTEVDMSKGYNHLYLTRVINQVCTINSVMPLRTVYITIWTNIELEDED